MKKLYNEMRVWRRVDDSRVVRYVCFQVLPDNKYCVQSADFFSLGSIPDQIAAHESQMVDLLLEESPESRAERVFDTLEEAILSHDKEFQNSDWS